MVMMTGQLNIWLAKRVPRAQWRKKGHKMERWHRRCVTEHVFIDRLQGYMRKRQTLKFANRWISNDNPAKISLDYT